MWRWFLENQASPGLFTWWDGEGEENNFGRWQRLRGWVTPPHVTPHYWTAAEIVNLRGWRCTVKPGPGFPADAVVRVRQ